MRKLTITTDHASYEITRMCADQNILAAYCTWVVTPVREPLHQDARSIRACVEAALTHAEHIDQTVNNVVQLIQPRR